MTVALLWFTGKRGFELGGVVYVGLGPQGAVYVVTEETEGVVTWFVAESLEVVVMFKFVIIFML